MACLKNVSSWKVHCVKTKILSSFYSSLNDHTIVFPAHEPHKWKSTFKVFKHPSCECHMWIIASKDFIISILLRAKLNGIIHISNQLYLKMSSYKRFITYLGLMLYLYAKHSSNCNLILLLALRQLLHCSWQRFTTSFLRYSSEISKNIIIYWITYCKLVLYNLWHCVCSASSIIGLMIHRVELKILPIQEFVAEDIVYLIILMLLVLSLHIF